MPEGRPECCWSLYRNSYVMRLVEVLQLGGAIIGVAAALITSVEQRLIRRLKQEEATTAKTAVTLVSQNPVSKWWIARLISTGAITSAGNNRLYLNEPVFRILRKKRKIRALTLFLAALAIVVILIMIFK